MPAISSRTKHKQIVALGLNFDPKLHGLCGLILANQSFHGLQVISRTKGEFSGGAPKGKL
jgi:hypothetical protein